MGINGYRELAAALRRAIEQGDFSPGETLPKQADLAAEYGVNIKTVRNAVAVLESEGLVTPIRRRGTVVRERPPMRRLGVERYARKNWKFNGLVAFAADRENSGRQWKPEDQVNAVSLVDADVEVADAFGIEPGDPVYMRMRLVSDNGQPTHVLTSYYLPKHVEGTPLVDPAPGPAGQGGGFAVLTLQGMEPHHMTETISARMPSPVEIEQLLLPAGEPVMVLCRQTYTDTGVLVEYARGLHAASRFAWTYSFDVPD